MSWMIGNLLWVAGWPLYQVVSWWIGFLVLTIAGERLELSRLLQPSRAAQRGFVAVAVLFIVGLAFGGIGTAIGARVSGVALIGLTAWLARHDVARRTVRQRGLTRLTAVCLLSGYVWLGVTGVLALLFGGVIAGLHYDAVLHAVFLGFVFAMIFGHAPIILPAVLGLPVPFRAAFYAHVAVLHLSLMLRVAADLAGVTVLREWAGLLNVIAVLLFLANTVWSVRQGRSAASLRTATHAVRDATAL